MGWREERKKGRENLMICCCLIVSLPQPFYWTKRDTPQKEKEEMNTVIQPVII